MPGRAEGQLHFGGNTLLEGHRHDAIRNGLLAAGAMSSVLYVVLAAFPSLLSRRSLLSRFPTITAAGRQHLPRPQDRVLGGRPVLVREIHEPIFVCGAEAARGSSLTCSSVRAQ
jgi:hypothetical protein